MEMTERQSGDQNKSKRKKNKKDLKAPLTRHEDHFHSSSHKQRYDLIPDSNPTRIIFPYDFLYEKYTYEDFNKVWTRNFIKKSDIKEVVKLIQTFEDLKIEKKFKNSKEKFICTLLCFLVLVLAFFTHSIQALKFTTFEIILIIIMGIIFLILSVLYLFQLCQESPKIRLKKVIELNKILQNFNDTKFSKNGCLLVMGNKGLWIELIIKNPIMSEEQFELMSRETGVSLRKTLQGMMFESMLVHGNLEESTVIGNLKSGDEEDNGRVKVKNSISEEINER